MTDAPEKNRFNNLEEQRKAMGGFSPTPHCACMFEKRGTEVVVVSACAAHESWRENAIRQSAEWAYKASEPFDGPVVARNIKCCILHQMNLPLKD